MARKRFGGKRKPLYVECQKCKVRFEFWTDGSAYWKRLPTDSEFGMKREVPLKLIGRRREWPERSNYRLNEWVHGDVCEGKLKRLDIPDPIRKVMPGRTKLECGHDYHERQDLFGGVPGMRRACRECGKTARIEAVKSGKMEAWEVGLRLDGSQ